MLSDSGWPNTYLTGENFLGGGNEDLGFFAPYASLHATTRRGERFSQ